MCYTKEVVDKAKRLIEETIKEAVTESDRAYAVGLIEMAYHLEVIKPDEQLRYKAILYR